MRVPDDGRGLHPSSFWAIIEAIYKWELIHMSAVREHVLSNGMTILCWHNPYLHGVEMGLYLRAGTIYETEETQGISHLLEHLCFRGVGDLNHESLQRTLNRFGADMEGMTTAEAIVFRLTSLPRYFDGMLELFTKFFAPNFWSPEDIEKEKEIVLRQIEQAEEDFDEMVDRAWRETPAGVFPRMGSAEAIAKLDNETIWNWQRLVFQPQNACLVLTGNFSIGMEETAIEVLAGLENYTSEPPFAQHIPLGFCMRDAESDLIVDSADPDSQAQVHIAFDIDEDNVFPLAARIVDAITAGNDDSILFQTLREEEALVAEIESYIQEMGQFHRLVIRYDVRQEKLVESLRKVFKYLHRLSVYVRPIRLEQVRSHFTVGHALTQDNISEMNELAGWAWVAGDASRADLDAQAAQLNDLSPEELLDAAQTIFRPENLVISVERDPEIVQENLDELFLELRGLL
ncbi:MAG: insulinase family protein [Clostridiales bacterium]|nr:insulinase family protein [Clostridiales bacterium]